MEIAGAEVESLKEVLLDDGFSSKLSMPLPEGNKTDYVKEYIEKHSQSSTNVADSHSPLS